MVRIKRDSKFLSQTLKPQRLEVLKTLHTDLNKSYDYIIKCIQMRREEFP